MASKKKAPAKPVFGPNMKTVADNTKGKGRGDPNIGAKRKKEARSVAIGKHMANC